jgi:hypothetical protein
MHIKKDRSKGNRFREEKPEHTGQRPEKSKFGNDIEGEECGHSTDPEKEPGRPFPLTQNPEHQKYTYR